MCCVFRFGWLIWSRPVKWLKCIRLFKWMRIENCVILVCVCWLAKRRAIFTSETINEADPEVLSAIYAFRMNSVVCGCVRVVHLFGKINNDPISIAFKTTWALIEKLPCFILFCSFNSLVLILGIPHVMVRSFQCTAMAHTRTTDSEQKNSLNQWKREKWKRTNA